MFRRSAFCRVRIQPVLEAALEQFLSDVCFVGSHEARSRL